MTEEIDPVPSLGNSHEFKNVRSKHHAHIAETKDAYDQARLDRLDCRDLRDAIEFDTELKDTFGVAWLDDEAREPLLNALERVQILIEDGGSTTAGIAVTALKILMKGHPRGFGRYYTGKDPWPLPSDVVQAEIDRRLPFALEWLRVELAEALSEEADGATERSNGGADHPVVEAARDQAAEVGSVPTGGQEAIAMLRFRSEEPDPTDGRLMIAIDRRYDNGSPEKISPETMATYYVSCLQRIKPDVELFGAGGMILDQIGMDIPVSATVDLLDLEVVDPDLHRAFHASLFSVIATTVGPVDLCSAVHALATFMRELGCFADVVKRRSWQLPYGEHTAYCTATVPEEDFSDDEDL